MYSHVMSIWHNVQNWTIRACGSTDLDSYLLYLLCSIPSAAAMVSCVYLAFARAAAVRARNARLNSLSEGFFDIRTLCPDVIPMSPDNLSLQFKTIGLMGFGMTDLSSFQSIIDLWPSREAMAADIGAKASAVSKWWQRDSVPAEWWSAVLATEIALG